MNIRIIATGQEGQHTALFPNTAFAAGDTDITPERLAANGCEQVVQSVVQPDAEQIEAQRVASLWQAAHDYESAEISGSAVGLLAMGVMQGKPKCTAVQNWIKGVWTEYYIRKAGVSTDTDYSCCGACPYTVPELMEELGL